MLIKRVTSSRELDDVFRIRYRVYCLERNYERPEDYPYGLEIDEYDPYSIHFISYMRSYPVGTVRLILPNPNGFPVEKYCNVEMRTLCSDTSKVAEISRLAVSSDIAKKLSIHKTKFTLGLLRELCHTVSRLNISCLLVAMGTGLDRLLNRCGMRFIKIGGPVDYHGIRIPCFAYLEDLKRELYEKRRDIYESFFPIQEYALNKNILTTISHERQSHNAPGKRVA